MILINKPTDLILPRSKIVDAIFSQRGIANILKEIKIIS